MNIFCTTRISHRQPFYPKDSPETKRQFTVHVQFSVLEVAWAFPVNTVNTTSFEGTTSSKPVLNSQIFNCTQELFFLHNHFCYKVWSLHGKHNFVNIKAPEKQSKVPVSFAFVVNYSINVTFAAFHEKKNKQKEIAVSPLHLKGHLSLWSKYWQQNLNIVKLQFLLRFPYKPPSPQPLEGTI